MQTTVRRLLPLAGFLLFCGSILSCSSGKLRLKELPAGRTPTESPSQLQFVAHGPQPPLHLVETVGLSSAPAQELVAQGGTLFASTKDGKVFAYDVRARKTVGSMKLSGNVASSLALAGDSLLIVGISLGRETLNAYHLAGGNFRWKTRAGLLSGQAVVADTSVYVVARFNHADRYSLRDGSRLWQYTFDSQAHTRPALSERFMLFGTDRGMIFALTRRSGAKVWQQQAGGAIFASPVLDSSTVYIASLDSTIRAFRLENGDSLWLYTATASIRHTPALAGSLLIFGAGDGSVEAIEAQTGRPIWRFQATSGIGTAPLVVKDVVYIGSFDKNLYALSRSTGSVLWKQELNGRVRTNPIIVDDYLVIGSEDRHIFLFSEAAPVN